MISILFCAVMIKISRFFSDEMIVCNIILFFAFLTHCIILKNFLKQFSEVYIIVRKLFFLCCAIILFFRLQIFTYVYHSLKMRHARLKRRVFLIILMHFRDHSNFVRSWNLIQDMNRSVTSSKVCKSFVV